MCRTARLIALVKAGLVLCVAMSAPIALAQTPANPPAPASATSASAAASASTAATPASTAPATCTDPLLAAYDVVSVKESHPERLRSVGTRELADGLDGENTTLGMMVQSAYSKERMLPLEDAVNGLPDWGNMPNYFSVEAKMGPDQVVAFKALDKDHQRACRNTMLQALLEDRFKLKVHRETRQVLGYELTVAKGGPKMQETAGADPNAPNGPDGKPITGSYMSMRMGKPGTMEIVGHGYTMQQLVSTLTMSNIGVNHRVVDKTGLTAKYNFDLVFASSSGVGPAGGPTDASDPAPTIFQALEDLGLHLQRSPVTIEVVIVDHAEKPTSD